MKRLAKTVSHGAVHIAVGATAAFVLTGSWGISMGVALLEVVLLTLIHPLHEWVWDHALVRVPVSDRSHRHHTRSRMV
jgi:uncharacterized membrane protein